MFQLTPEEFKVLRCQFVTSNKSQGGHQYLPYVFTEQGIAMLSGLLNSDVAIFANIQIMRAFVALRQYAIAQSSKNAEIEELRRLLLLYIYNHIKGCKFFLLQSQTWHAPVSTHCVSLAKSLV